MAADECLAVLADEPRLERLLAGHVVVDPLVPGGGAARQEDFVDDG